MPIEADNDYQPILDRYTLQKEGKADANSSAKIQLLELLGLASFMSGSAALVTMPMIDKKIGGASLMGVGLVAADLHHKLFGGRVVDAAQAAFGGTAEAMRTMGVLACTVLSAGGFYRMVKDGGVKNPMDPRWLGVIATAAPFMAGHMMMQPEVKAWVEDKFGETLTLAKAADDKKDLKVPTAPFFKQLAFVIGGAHILAYGMIKSDHLAKFIGSAFMVGPSMSLGNLLWKGAHHVRPRIHFLSVTDPKQDAIFGSQPIVNENGKFDFDQFVKLVGMAKTPALM